MSGDCVTGWICFLAALLSAGFFLVTSLSLLSGFSLSRFFSFIFVLLSSFLFCLSFDDEATPFFRLCELLGEALPMYGTGHKRLTMNQKWSKQCRTKKHMDVKATYVLNMTNCLYVATTQSIYSLISDLVSIFLELDPRCGCHIYVSMHVFVFPPSPLASLQILSPLI